MFYFVKKIVFIFILLITFCYSQQSKESISEKAIKASEKNFHEMTFDIRNLLIFITYSGRDFTSPFPSIPSEEYIYTTPLSVYFDYLNMAYGDGFFRYLYKIFGLYGDGMTKDSFGLGLQLGYSIERESVSKDKTPYSWQHFYTYQRFKLGLTMDLSHGLLWTSSILSTISLVALLTYQPKYDVIHRDIIDGDTTPLAFMGYTIIGLGLFTVSFFTLPITHFFEKMGFYFHTVQGVYYDLQYHNSKFTEDKAKNFLGIYYGLKVGFKFIKIGKSHIVLKTGLVYYLPIANFLNNSHWSMPFEFGLKF